MRRIANQQLNVEVKIRDFKKVSFQHRAIAGNSEPAAVVADVIVDELIESRPVLLVETGNVASVEIAEVGFHHG